MRAGVLNLEPCVPEDFSKALFPRVFGGTTAPRSLSDLQAIARSPPIEAVDFDQFLDRAVTEDFLPQLVVQGEFPVVSRKVTCAHARALKVPALHRGQRTGGRGEAYAEIDLAAAKDR